MRWVDCWVDGGGRARLISASCRARGTENISGVIRREMSRYFATFLFSDRNGCNALLCVGFTVLALSRAWYPMQGLFAASLVPRFSFGASTVLSLSRRFVLRSIIIM